MKSFGVDRDDHWKVERKVERTVERTVERKGEEERIGK